MEDLKAMSDLVMKLDWAIHQVTTDSRLMRHAERAKNAGRAAYLKGKVDENKVRIHAYSQELHELTLDMLAPDLDVEAALGE